MFHHIPIPYGEILFSRALPLQLPAPSALSSVAGSAKPSRPATSVSVVVYGQISKEFLRTAPPQMTELLKVR